ncbi:MAG TPA: pyrroloquinoline quinone-dependent dehydrogenase [Candidatus Saccharimonadales bacterium]|jgi:quinoprotein glucose dehydrogenase|nr:pyrroloquinoline quinone-dependent dehydrogenase [Candidatus Saccharimonadales bacterium]
MRRSGIALKNPTVWLLALIAMSAAALAQNHAANVDWTTYAADLAGTRYRPLDQINASNFSKLEIAWRFKTDSLGNRPEYKLEGTPLEVHGVLYTTAGSRRAAIALDAATGELLWVHGEREGARGAAAPRQLSGRGLAYWSNGKEERILYVTPGYRLICLDAKTGALVPSFGDHGAVDLKLDDDQTFLPDITTGEIGFQSAPVVAGDTVIVGAAFREGFTPRSMRNNKGYVRGFDVRTGKRLWIFHTIPKKGEFGYDTWLNGSAEYTGNTGMWTQLSVDKDLGLVYLPIESPTGDFYGGHRRGNNLFGESLVCVDLKTGQRKWHFQLVHHPLWDMDISSAPILADITVDGKPVKAVAQPTKQGFLYVFDRITGEPVWPIEERPVEQGKVPGEWYAPTQPFPTKPPAYSRNGVSIDDLIDFTPALREQATKIVSRYHLGPVFTPPVVSEINGPLGTLTLGTAGGGTNWPGASYDPETHILYAFACNACLTPLGLVQPPKDVSDMDYVAGTAGQRVQMRTGPGENSGADSPLAGRGRTSPPAAGGGGGGYGGLSVDGLPLIKPPYGTITAINLDKGEIVWQIAHGGTPDLITNHPALKGLNLPRTGQTTYNVGTLITKTLVIAGEGQISTTEEHPRGAMLRAYDKATGKEVGAVYMPAQQSGSPMTYMLNGKQYIVVAVSGGAYSGEYIAFTLPEADE